MAPPGDDSYCRQFQPNAFDPSRCSSCLRPDHMHLTSTNAARADAAQLGDLRGQEADDDDEQSEVTTSASSDDVSGGWTYEWSLVRSLSPEWELENCGIQSSSSVQWDCSDRSRSHSSERSCGDQREMTRLDPSSPQDTESSWMDERRGRDRSRQASESRGEREKESGYFSPDRRGGDGVQQTEEVNKRTYRFYEKGHPLPSNYVLEPKACVPYRNVSLGLPSQRRNQETYMQETWRSESPQRYTYHSNFRRGCDSQRNSPTRHNSVSPDRYRGPEPPLGPQRGSSLCRSQNRSHDSSHSSSQLPSHGPSHHTSGRSSPARRRSSLASRTSSPSRTTHSHRRTDSLLSQSRDYDAQKGSSQESRSASRATNRHSLDSEKLYRNLESISRRGSSAVQHISYQGSQASPRTRTAVSSLTNTQTHNSRDISPTRNGYSLEPNSRDSRISRSQGSWQGSSHSLLSLPPSHGSSSSRRCADSQVLGGSLSNVVATETDMAIETSNNASADRSRSNMRRGMDALLISEPKNAPVEPEEVAMTMEDYILLADIPKIQVESEEDFPRLRWRNQSPSPCRDQRPRTHRYQEETNIYSSRLESEERGRGRQRGRDRREKCRDSENGRSSRRQSTASLHSQISGDQSGTQRSLRVKERVPPEHLQTQVCMALTLSACDERLEENGCCWPKGWMSRLDEQGKWRKHWFVLGDTSLRYYRDSEAEESDDLDGEIDLTSCVKVSDCDVDRNYGLQIQTKRAVFTLSAVTSRIRRNWVKLLKQTVQNNRHQSDASSEKENPLSCRPSSCQPPARLTCGDSGDELATCAAAADSDGEDRHRRGDLSADLSPATRREEGEGWDREQAKRLEERNRWFEEGAPLGEMGSRWDSMDLKKGSVPVPVIETMDSEVNRKWAEFETLSFGDMSAQSLIGAQVDQPSIPQESNLEEAGSRTNAPGSEEAPPPANTAEALQKEAASLRKQVESIRKERAAMGMEVGSPCGPGAPCRARLEAMEASHRKELQELQEKHARQIREMLEEKDRVVQEESEAAAKAMEAVKAAHREELEREVEKVRRMCGGPAHMDSSSRGHIPQPDVLHGELDVLSERYSQKCLDLTRIDQNGVSRESELNRRQRELEQLQRENQELKNKLAEEISRMRYFITGQRSDVVSPGNTERTTSELETLLRAKENEVEYLKKEMLCLQNEVQSLTKDKEDAYERYKEAYVELSNMRGRSQLEMTSLNEHLRLANAALQEEARNT